MKVWFLVSQKGGATKTTIATNLSVIAAQNKEKILLVDLDPQEHCVMWWQGREADNVRVVKSSPTATEVQKVIRLAKEKGFTHIIFDTAGQDKIEHNEILQYASFCIVPCQTSLLDIRAVKTTVAMLERIRKPFCFIITRCPVTGEDQNVTRKGLSFHGPVCPTPTIERKAYKLSYGLNLSVVEYEPKGKAADEIQNIYKWIINQEKRINNSEF